MSSSFCVYLTGYDNRHLKLQREAAAKKQSNSLPRYAFTVRKKSNVQEEQLLQQVLNEIMQQADEESANAKYMLG